MTNDTDKKDGQEILVVDDTPASLQLLTRILKEQGYRVRPASGALLGLRSAEARTPDLILLDVKMPEMDGFEVCRRLKSDDRTRHIPVLFISAMGDVTDKVKGFEAGGVDYITKPFDPAEVAARVGIQLRMRSLARSLEEANRTLEMRVQERTTQLAAANKELQAEVAERGRMEQERERLLADLTRSNKELEQFAYVASHDLQEPIRMISSYVQLLDRKYHGKLDQKADSYIHYAVEGAERMQKLIEDLLAFCKISRREDEFGWVDLNNVFQLAVSNLSVTLRENEAKVTKEELPVIWGDETQFVQLLQNLIGNAVKYRKPDVRPLVHITGRSEGGDNVISIRDNGIGIQPQFYEKIFQIFQRLHPRSEYSGTGIGLALCKRIVERHRGRIWVESVPGEGSTFFFSVPKEIGLRDACRAVANAEQAKAKKEAA